MMNAKLSWASLLAALVVAGLPGVSTAGWCSGLLAGLRPPEAPQAVAAETETTKAEKPDRDAIFQLTCHSRRGSGYYAGYGSYYPSYSCYGRSSSYYYPRYSYYGGYSSCYAPSYSCYPGCGGWSPCGGQSYSSYPGW